MRVCFSAFRLKGFEDLQRSSWGTAVWPEGRRLAVTAMAVLCSPSWGSPSKSRMLRNRTPSLPRAKILLGRRGNSHVRRQENEVAGGRQ